ncbi:MAG: CpXC domain-containing protein [Endomicrobiia bacterium]
MSFIDKKEIKCLCGKVFNTKVVLSVNLAQTPELKEVILEGRFNIVECPFCKKLLYVEIPFFYLDPEENMVIYVFPKSYENEKEKYLREAETNFSLSLRTIENIEEKKGNYFLQVFFGIEELVEFLIFQEKENDEKEFLCKIVDTINLKMIDFPPQKSRPKNIISKLPYIDKGTKVCLDNVIEGLSLLLNKYPQLEIYNKLLNDIKFNNSVREIIENLLEEQEEL